MAVVYSPCLNTHPILNISQNHDDGSNIYSNAPLQMQTTPLNIICTGPRWARLWETQSHANLLLSQVMLLPLETSKYQHHHYTCLYHHYTCGMLSAMQDPVTVRTLQLSPPDGPHIEDTRGS